MTKVVALVAFSNGTITMEEKGIYDIDDALAADLIAQGLCADAATYFGGGGSGGGVLVVKETQHTGELLVSGTLPNVDGYCYTTSHGEGSLEITVTGIANKNLDEIVVTIGDIEYSGLTDLSIPYGDNTLKIRLKDEQQESELAIIGLVITVAEDYTALDHTWQEISDAGFAVFNYSGDIFTLSSIYGEDGYYGASFDMCYSRERGVEIFEIGFSTSSASGYPTRDE